MTVKTGEHIITPLAEGTAANFEAVLAGRTALRTYEHYDGLRDPLCASLFTDEQLTTLRIDGLTDVESLACHSITSAASQAGIDLSDPDTLLIVSTTKGNVALLADNKGFDPKREWPGEMATAIARHLGMKREPITVCNACVSGLSAMILAKRLLDRGMCRRAVVCGIELQCKFILSGFLAFKALSAERCRPFDKDRVGLNAGDACATIILENVDAVASDSWVMTSGAVANDANHISAPSRTAEGAVRALSEIELPSTAALVGVHGTATPYNDSMEAIALHRSGLDNVPVSSFKAFYGHTMGAAGVLETLLCMHSVERGIVPGIPTLSEAEDTGIMVSSSAQPCTGESFVKILSGFGGVNAAVGFSFGKDVTGKPDNIGIDDYSAVEITPTGASVDGVLLPTQAHGAQLLTELYRAHVGDYPKYFKMDLLTRLAFVASELLLKGTNTGRCDIILFNSASSLIADSAHQQALDNAADGATASPSVFVYTLPNITTGEIAIRNKTVGATSFYVFRDCSEKTMREIVEAEAARSEAELVLWGLVEAIDSDNFEASLHLSKIMKLSDK